MNTDNNILPRTNVPPPLPRSVIEKNKPEEKIDSKERENRGPPAIRPLRPKSPRDTTQIVINGTPVDREQIMPIILPENEDIPSIIEPNLIPVDTSPVDDVNKMQEAILNLYNNTSDIKYIPKEIILPKDINIQIDRQQSSQRQLLSRQDDIDSSQRQQLTSSQRQLLSRQDDIDSSQRQVLSRQDDSSQRQSYQRQVLSRQDDIEDDYENDIHSTDATTPLDIIKPTSILSPDPGSLPEIPRQNTVNIPNKQTISNKQSVPIKQTVPNTQTVPNKQTIPTTQTVPIKQSVPNTQVPKTVPNKQTSTTNGTTSGQPKKIIRTIIKRAPLSPRTSDQLKKLGYITNYTRLKDSWPEYKFPEIPEDASTDYVIRAYEHCISKIQVDMNVNQYKAGLIILFLVIEVISVKYLGLDGGGYTASQIKAMSRYERLLIEMGEKRMIVVGNNWPVEARITFIAIVNFGIFVLMKFLSGMLGPDLSGMLAPLLTNLFSGHSTQQAVKENKEEIPDVPDRNTNLSGLVGTFAQMASNALNGNNSNNSTNQSTNQNFRRPTYRQ
jgi:hypothetical protein